VASGCPTRKERVNMKQDANKARGKRGVKSTYNTKILSRFDEIFEWRRDGHNAKNIAKMLGISENCLYQYKRKHPEFKELLEASSEALVDNLEDTMFRMALGKVKVKKTKRYIQTDGRTGAENTKIEETEEELPPNATLLIFSLKNLSPTKWRDVQDVTFNDMENAKKNMDTVFAEMKEKLDKSENGKLTLPTN